MKLQFCIILCLIHWASYSQQLKEAPIYKEPAPPAYKDFKPTVISGKAGVINNSTFETLIPFEYDNIEKISDAMPYFIARQQGKYGILNAQGKIVIGFDYQVLRFYNISSKDYFDEMLADNDFVLQVKKNGSYGFIDIHNKPIVPLEYDSMRYERSTSFPASKAGKWGIINLKGDVKLPFQYEEIEPVENAYKVRNKEEKGIISKEGKILLPVQYTTIDYFKNSALKATPYYIVTDKNSKKGVWDTKTQSLYIPALYDKVTDVCEGNFIVVLNNRYGVVDAKNKMLIPCEYDYLKYLSVKTSKQPLLAMVKGKYGLINTLKQKLVDFQYDDIQRIAEGFYKAGNNGKYKVIDAAGRIITKEAYDHIGVFVNGEAGVFKGKQISYINTHGEPGNFRPSDALGYTDLRTLLEDFTNAMNSKNDSILRAFCKNVTPDKHTVSFLERSGYNGPPLLYDLQKKAYTLEDIPDMWFDRLKRFSGKLKDTLQYINQDNDNIYIENEQFCVEGLKRATKFRAGDKEVNIRLGGLMRVDGIWKSFSLPSMAD